MTSFFEQLEARSKSVDSLLCVGLDPHKQELEENTAAGVIAFCTKLIEATSAVAAAYKPNAAFFEALGSEVPAAAPIRSPVSSSAVLAY
jgi:uridine monophosphate synthetase